MAKIKILAGDFLDGHAVYEPGYITIETAVYPWPRLKIAKLFVHDSPRVIIRWGHSCIEMEQPPMISTSQP